MAAHILAEPSSFKKGGKVKKSGLALVHKGERILRAGRERDLSAGHAELLLFFLLRGWRQQSVQAQIHGG